MMYRLRDVQQKSHKKYTVRIPKSTKLVQSHLSFCCYSVPLLFFFPPFGIQIKISITSRGNRCIKKQTQNVFIIDLDDSSLKKITVLLLCHVFSKKNVSGQSMILRCVTEIGVYNLFRNMGMPSFPGKELSSYSDQAGKGIFCSPLLPQCCFCSTPVLTSCN